MSRHFMSGGRYPILRTIAILYLICGVVAAIAGIVIAFFALFGGVRIISTWGERWYVFAATLAVTFFVCITMLAISEIIKLFMDVEHNSRAAAINAGQIAGGSTVLSSTPTGPATANLAASAMGNGHSGRLSMIDEESAEGALVRGH